MDDLRHTMLVFGTAVPPLGVMFLVGCLYWSHTKRMRDGQCVFELCENPIKFYYYFVMNCAIGRGGLIWGRLLMLGAYGLLPETMPSFLQDIFR